MQKIPVKSFSSTDYGKGTRRTERTYSWVIRDREDIQLGHKGREDIQLGHKGQRGLVIRDREDIQLGHKGH